MSDTNANANANDAEGDGDGESEEYRPRDFLAICRMSWGHGAHKQQAMSNAMANAGPFDPDDPDEDPVTVHVWEMYADSWQKHGISGPERTADVISHEVWQVPVKEACDLSETTMDSLHAWYPVRDESDVEVEYEADDADADTEAEADAE